jgi:prepilin-type N-terminal cleavage/methylation domain-containing protein
MKNKYHLQAFTLLELLIVMLISGIVFTLAGGVYLTFSKTIKSWQEKGETQQSLYLFEEKLSGEINNCRWIEPVRNGFMLRYSSKQPVYYQFGDTFIIRNSVNTRDTFFFHLNNYSFRKLKTDSIELIDKIIFTATVKQDSFPVEIRKSYASEMLYNLTHHDDTD